MTQKNKQYKLEKGLMLFTQPRSPYFYGKIRFNKKYLTKSFAPIVSRADAELELYAWRDSLFQNDILIQQYFLKKLVQEVSILSMKKLPMIFNSWKLEDLILRKKV